jgi:hypothetical protein
MYYFPYMPLHKIVIFLAFDPGKIHFIFFPIPSASPSIQRLADVSDIAEIEAQILHWLFMRR